MLESTKMKALPVLNRATELAPAATACCGACRTCATTNAFTVLAAAAVGTAGILRRLLGRS